MLIVAILVFLLIFKLFKEFGKVKEAQTPTEIEKEMLTRAVIEGFVNSIDKKQESLRKTSFADGQLAADIESLQQMFPDFLPESFLAKAEDIFDSVFNAFANPNYHILKKTLTESLYEEFAEQIKKRDENNLRQEILIRHKKTTLEKIQTIANKAKLLVSFDVSQMSAITNSEGISFDNPNRLYREIIHKWVFERDKGQTDWILSKTSSAEV